MNNRRGGVSKRGWRAWFKQCRPEDNLETDLIARMTRLLKHMQVILTHGDGEITSCTWFQVSGVASRRHRVFSDFLASDWLPGLRISSPRNKLIMRISNLGSRFFPKYRGAFGSHFRMVRSCLTSQDHLMIFSDSRTLAFVPSPGNARASMMSFSKRPIKLLVLSLLYL